MSELALRVTHPSLLTDLLFYDDELPQFKVRWRMGATIRQQTQTGNVIFQYIGQDRAILEMTFEIFRHGEDGTLEKLDQIRRIQEAFTVYPMLKRYAGTRFRVWWGEDDLVEEWVVGDPRAQYDHPVTWEEATTGSCPEILFS